LLESLHEGPKETNAELIGAIGDIDVRGFEAEEAAGRAVCRLLSRTAYGYMRAQLGPSHFLDRIKDARHPTRTMRLLASRLNAVNRRVVMLYEEDFGTTRETLHRLGELSAKAKHVVPYFEVFVRAAAESELGGEAWDGTTLAESIVPRLFGQDALLLRFAEGIVERGESLKTYGGETNTILGVYAWLADPAVFDLSRIPRDAEANLDLGGGFATPEVTDLFGVPFTSLDVCPPTRARELDIAFARKGTRGGSEGRVRVGPEEREAFLQRLDAQPWRPFDVFSDGFDPALRKVVITSFGFLSSSVVSLSSSQSKLPARLRASNNTYCAVRSVTELVGRGADVSLLTVQRSTNRALMNRAVFLRFRDHRLVDHQLVTEPFQGKYGRGVVPMPRGRSLRD